MVKKLGLKGSELIIYAIAYGQSQDEAGRWINCGMGYLEEWTGKSEKAVRKILESLASKGLIEYAYDNNLINCRIVPLKEEK